MAARRHLPVLPNHPPPKAPTSHPTSSETDEKPPPWHWIPLGTVVSVVTFALLAQGAAALSVRALARVYGASATAATIARVRAERPFDARAAELVAGISPVVALSAAVSLGGFFIGRYGDRTNPRHGTLSGALTALLFWAVTGRMGVILALVPVCAAIGWISALGGNRVSKNNT